ncbi:cbb3-type cytochrome oxidase assembly protein CcoS [Microaerobacter geothermalis]|nr:cbb3-type cytochrome oxidase assembly protein CcoS [Microaerobacter geothermalis]MCF6092685.1 cbb3-type cytochrome oxidase assembly protein CcoS [Microaerobacter geothermalis]
MNLSVLLFFVVFFSFVGSSVLVLWWCKKSGQFDDVEGIKYRMLEDE